MTALLFAGPNLETDDLGDYSFADRVRFTCDRPRSMTDVLREMAYWRPMCRDHARERQQRYERLQRAQRLHRAYRRRSLARRRRNR